MATGTVVDVVMPQMGVSVSEGTITRWLRTVGDHIQADDPLLEISTDKVDTEVPSPGSGVLLEILVQEGQTVPVGTLVARIGADLGDAADTLVPEPTVEPTLPEPLPPEALEEPPPLEVPAEEPPAAAPSQPETAGNGKHTFVSPVVARIASEYGIDPAQVPGTGRDGRVTKKDILAFVEGEERQALSAPAPAAPPPPVEAAAPPPPPPPPPPPAPPAPPQPAAPQQPAAPAAVVAQAQVEPGDTIEPMSAMRRGIAEHMRRSLDTAAHVTSAIEVDMSTVVGIRERLKPEFATSYGVNLTYLAFISRAAVETLREWPYVNAEIRGESIVTHSYVNLGFAVALEGGKGLIVPVLKHAEGLNLLGMARGVADLAERARTKKLLPDDVQGGTFTITNPGSYGTFLGTPVISRPQTGILGTYAVVKRPWVITDDTGGDAIAIRPIMNLTLTYDHRLVDGAYAGQFLRDLTARLTGWVESDY